MPDFEESGFGREGYRIPSSQRGVVLYIRPRTVLHFEQLTAVVVLPSTAAQNKHHYQASPSNSSTSKGLYLPRSTPVLLVSSSSLTTTPFVATSVSTQRRWELKGRDTRGCERVKLSMGTDPGKGVSDYLRAAGALEDDGGSGFDCLRLFGRWVC